MFFVHISYVQSTFSLSSENALMSPFIPEVIFPSYGILGWHFFSFRAWKMPCLFLLASAVSDEKATVIQIVSPSQQGVISSLLFSRLFLYFSKVWLMYRGMDFFGFNLCGVHSASWLYKLMSFAIFGSFLAIISFNTFLCHFLFFIFWSLWWHKY